MATFVAFVGELSQKEATDFYKTAVKWFKANPDRKTANTNICTIRRDHITEDILKYCAKSVVLPPPSRKKKKTTKKAKKAKAKEKELPDRWTKKADGKKIKQRAVRPLIKKTTKK